MKTLTATFFYVGAANVQKAVQILCAHFPWAMCFHGGEHVLSLFYSDLSRNYAVKVSWLDVKFDMTFSKSASCHHLSVITGHYASVYFLFV